MNRQQKREQRQGYRQEADQDERAPKVARVVRKAPAKAKAGPRRRGR